MGDHHFDVVSGQVDDRVQRVGGHVLVQQIHQSVAGIELFPVIENGQPRVEEHIVLQQVFHILLFVLIRFENLPVGNELNLCTIGLVCRLDVCLLRDDRLAVDDPFAFTVATAGDAEVTAQRIDRLDTDTIQSDRLLEGFAVILGSGVHLAGDIHHLA